MSKRLLGGVKEVLTVDEGYGARLGSAGNGLRKAKTPPEAFRRIERGEDERLITRDIPVVNQGHAPFASEPAGIGAISPS